MPRTAITVTSLDTHQDGTALTQTTGDAANDHSVDASYVPRLHLWIFNTAANSIDYSLLVVSSNVSYDQAHTVSNTITSGEDQLIPLDIHPDMAQSGNVIHIDSADANFSDLRFMAFTWRDSPRRF